MVDYFDAVCDFSFACLFVRGDCDEKVEYQIDGKDRIKAVVGNTPLGSFVFQGHIQRQNSADKEEKQGDDQLPDQLKRRVLVEKATNTHLFFRFFDELHNNLSLINFYFFIM